MSIWTNNRALLCVAALALSACVAGPVGGSSKAPARMTVLAGSVTIAGPRGYCIDRDASRSSATQAVVLLGSCAALAGTRLMPAPRAPVVLTASVLVGDGAALEASYPALGEFFRTEAGRAALSRSGDFGDVEILEAFTGSGAYYVRLRDRSGATDAESPVEPEYWRALVGLNDRILTLSALALVNRPQSQEVKRAALVACVAQMHAATPVVAVTEAAAAPSAGTGG